jgi:hypothetical protein
MAPSPQRIYVRDLKTWDLPRLEDLEERLTAEFAGKARLVFLEGERSGGQLHALFLERLRELAGAAVNEILEYWLKGLVDGCDGRFPELCVELPYLERAEGDEPLALAYCVDNEDGSRTELIRITLDRVLERILDESPPAANNVRLENIARQLRSLAKSLEQRAHSLGR